MRRKQPKAGQSTPADLDRELSRLRARASRQKRNIGDNTVAWQSWSGTMDEALRVIARIAATPALTIGDLATTFAAILWAIETNESLLDGADLRRLKAFGRNLRRLGKAGR